MSGSINKSLNAVYEAALKLSAYEREQLVSLLSQNSTAAESELRGNAAWSDELRRRVELLRSGQMSVVPGDEAIKRARARLTAHRK